MKRLLPLLFCSLLAATALASNQIRDVQTELKEQGFYYGEVTGSESSELTAAIRRYQIRNGLEVTGKLDAPTLKALDVSGAAEPSAPVAKKTSPAPSNPPSGQTVTPPPPAAAPRPPVNLRRTETAQEEDRRFLEREPSGRQSYPTDRSIVRPPAPLDDEPVESSDEYRDLFAGTPYASAPAVVQKQTIQRAQTLLTSRGFYRDAIDGDAGPATEEAILAFQRSNRLRLTGRLDLETLASLRLLPGRGSGNPPMRPFNAAPNRGPRPVYRGVWVE